LDSDDAVRFELRLGIRPFLFAGTAGNWLTALGTNSSSFS
jgi:hypothetical protein